MRNVTGITPVGGANGEFNITPSMTKGDVGFRHYNNFKLLTKESQYQKVQIVS